MSPQAKSASSKSSSAATKASQTAKAANKSTEKVVQVTQQAAKKNWETGTETVIGMMNAGAKEMETTVERVQKIGRESANNVAQSADMVSRMSMEMLGMSRGNIEACVECSHITANAAKEMTSECFEFYNEMFTEQVELSKDAFNCRTISDVVELQNKMMQQTMDACFNQSARISNLMFEYCNEVMEPINSCMSECSDQMNKVLAS